MPPDPHPLAISAARSVRLAWTKRALFRLDACQPRPDLAEVRAGQGFRFLVCHLWAMLADEVDRRRFTTPEDLAAAFGDEPEFMRDAWRTMWRLAYEFDPDAPEVAAVGSVAAETPETPDPAEKKSAGETKSVSLGSNSTSAPTSTGPATPNTSPTWSSDGSTGKSGTGA